jgi:ribosomal protein S21
MAFKKKQSNGKGLYVEVKNNNIEFALKQLKQKIKESNLMVELREKSHYEKPSAKRRHVKNLAKLRTKYKKMEENYNDYY